MNESLHREGTDGEQSKESRMRQTLTLAAAVAMLGVSVGVDVQELLAAGPGETLQADQSKVGGIQSKESAAQSKENAAQNRGVTQQKLPAKQVK